MIATASIPRKGWTAWVTALLVFLIVLMPSVALADPSDDGGSGSSDGGGESVSGDTISSDGTANGRIQVFINLAKNSAEDNQKSIDFDSLSKNDFQFLGTLMTNFYVPYMTELGSYKDYGDDETSKKIEENARENQKKTMMASLNITETDAEVLLDFMITASQESAEPLKWAYGPTNMEKPDDLIDSKGQTPVTVYQLQKMISGAWGRGSPALSDTHGNPLNNTGEWGNSTSGYVCANDGVHQTGDDLKECWASKAEEWADDGKRKLTKDQEIVYRDGNNYAYLVTDDKKPVFSVNLSHEYTTPSVASLAFASQIMNAENGVGTSLFEYTDSDEDAALMKKLEEDGKIPKDAQNSIYGMPLYVDAFGNIIAMGVTHQYVLLPGAMNPFMWTPVDENGEDIPDAPAGSRLAPMNAIMMGLAGQDKLCTEAAADTCKLDMSGINELREGMISDGGWIPARIVRNSSETNMNTVGKSIFGLWGQEESGESTYIKTVFDAYAETNTVENGKNQTAVIDSPVADGLGDSVTSGVGIPYFGGQGIGMSSTELPSLNQVVTIDNLGAFQGEKPDDGFSGLFETVDLIDTSGKLASGEAVTLGDNKFTNKATDYEYGTQFKAEDVFGSDMAAFSTLYYTYAFASLDSGDDASYKKAQGGLGYRMNFDYFPELCSGSGEGVSSCKFQLSDEQKDARDEANADQQNEDIRNWIWYILNPVEGFNYVTLLIKNKVTASVMGLHSDIVGTTGAPSVAGSTKYLGFSGYVTIPELSDLPWTDALISGYNSNYFYVVIIVLVIMAAYAVTGVLTLQRAIGGAILFSVLAYTPAYFIDGAVNLSNRVTNNIYGEKFTYWALIQNQTYSEAIDKAASGDDYNNYLRTQMQANQEIDITGAGNNSTNKGADSVVVKWQAPKKMASLMFSSDDTDADKALMDNPLFSNVLAKDNANSGQAYTDSDASVYMFRSYIDLNNFSRFIYRGIADGNQEYNKSPSTEMWPEGLKNSWGTKDTTFANDVNAGYVNANADGNTNLTSGMRVSAPLSSDIVADTFNQPDKISAGLEKNENVGIDTRSFNFSLPAFNGEDVDMMEGIEDTTKAFDQGDFDSSVGGKYDSKDYTGLAAYSLMSESSFYYFSWSLYDQGMSPDSGATNGYKDLILQGSGSPYFYNVDGNNEPKDYLDMKSMFTYVIPYLKEGNDVVERFDDTYGLDYTPGVPTDEGHWEDEAIKSDPVMQQKYWKNLQVSRLYGLYAPWVDLMYEANYAEPQVVMVQGEKVSIQNPLDPSSYPDERPMVFSKSEQVDYGIDDGQLTLVERKIQEVQEGTQEGMFNLLNAYNFNDNVLNTAASIEATFEFNKAFSETHVLGQNIQLYPQSYELKNFSYDAYLRLILANATGEDISGQSADDFYISVVEDSSMLTALVIIVLDFLSVYVVPAFKVFLVLSIFVTMVMMILMGALRIMEGVWKHILNAIVKPLLSLLLVFIGMGWVVSIFMSNGNTSVTGYDGTSISLGDPIMTMLAMIAINALVVFLLWKISKNVWGHMVQYVKTIFGSMQGVASGAASMAKGIVQGKGFQEARATGSTSIAAAAGAGAAAGAATGGVANKRAQERASKNSSKVSDLGSGRKKSESKNHSAADDRSRKHIGKGTFGKNKPEENKSEQAKKRSAIDEKALGRKVKEGTKSAGESLRAGASSAKSTINRGGTTIAASSRRGRNRTLREVSNEKYHEARESGASRREARKASHEEYKERKQEYNRLASRGNKRSDALRQAAEIDDLADLNKGMGLTPLNMDKKYVERRKNSRRGSGRSDYGDE